MRGTRWLLAVLVLVAALVVGGRSAFAQSCTLSTTPVSFGTYDVFDAADLPSTGTIHYQCGLLFFRTVSVYLSNGSASSNNPRQMANGAERLAYNLYLDAGYTQIWGDPNPNAYSRFFLFSAPDVTLTVYGLIPALQDVAAGSYSDVVVATINF